MQRSGYIATVVGGALGAAVIGFAVGFSAAWVEIQANPDDGWAGLAGAVIGGTVGAVLGSGVGAWAALRLRRHERAGATGTVAAITGPAAIWIALIGIERLTGPASQGPMTVTAPLVYVAALVATRWAVVKWRAAGASVGADRELDPYRP